MFKKKVKKEVINTRFERVFLIVLDSLGIGEADDAESFDSVGANTLKHTLECSSHSFKNLKKLGLLNLVYDKNDESDAYYCKGNPWNMGKDTLTGHLEIAGVKVTEAFETFTEFPKEIVDYIESVSGRKVIGNCVASGTQIINDLGDEQVKTKGLIVYTSADSVLQIAAHESVVKPEELHHICKLVRAGVNERHYKIGRIIARPFTGVSGNYLRTSNRHDYPLDVPEKNLLDFLFESHYEVISIGKIADIFNNRGITMTGPTRDNYDGIRKLMDITRRDFKGLCFVNLNDFDTKYGHRRDAIGYADALRAFDEFLPHIITNLKDKDLLIITADHGNDPTFIGTDHTRECVPVLLYSDQFKNPKRLDNLDTFGDIGATIADNFHVGPLKLGKSFLKDLK